MSDASRDGPRSDRDVTASATVHKALSNQISENIRSALETHPVILADARHADHDARLADAVRLVESLTDQLAEAKATETAIRNGQFEGRK